MAYATKKLEGGQGGKRGHSNMSHWSKTEEIKKETKKGRREEDKMKEKEGMFESFLDKLKWNGNENLIENVKKGFRVCYEVQSYDAWRTGNWGEDDARYAPEVPFKEGDDIPLRIPFNIKTLGEWSEHPEIQKNWNDEIEKAKQLIRENLTFHKELIFEVTVQDDTYLSEVYGFSNENDAKILAESIKDDIFETIKETLNDEDRGIIIDPKHTEVVGVRIDKNEMEFRVEWLL
jgi:hypothetical protein